MEGGPGFGYGGWVDDEEDVEGSGGGKPGPTGGGTPPPRPTEDGGGGSLGARPGPKEGLKGSVRRTEKQVR